MTKDFRELFQSFPFLAAAKISYCFSGPVSWTVLVSIILTVLVHILPHSFARYDYKFWKKKTGIVYLIDITLQLQLNKLLRPSSESHFAALVPLRKKLCIWWDVARFLLHCTNICFLLLCWLLRLGRLCKAHSEHWSEPTWMVIRSSPNEQILEQAE